MAASFVRLREVPDDAGSHRAGFALPAKGQSYLKISAGSRRCFASSFVEAVEWRRAGGDGMLADIHAEDTGRVRGSKDLPRRSGGHDPAVGNDDQTLRPVGRALQIV